MSHLSDSEILQIFKEGNADYGFNLLLKKYQKQIYWLARRIVIDHDDADDVTQNTFIKIWQNIAEFREESKLFTWIYRIATNEALHFLKKKKSRFFIPFLNIEKDLMNSLRSEAWFDLNEAEKKFHKAILKLPQKQRIIFNLKYFENLKYEEISEILGTSVGALKASYHHAITKIEKFLTEN